MKRRSDAGFASEAYLHAKARWRGTTLKNRRHRGGDGVGSSPFSKGRDPKSLGDVLAIAAEDMGWSAELEQARIITEWPEFVGEVTAPHTRVVELRDGLIVVQCDSTAWATELRRMRAQVLTRILEKYPNAGIEDLRFLSPDAPTWRHGARVIRGRGPRDTYG